MECFDQDPTNSPESGRKKEQQTVQFQAMRKQARPGSKCGLERGDVKKCGLISGDLRVG